MCETAVAEGMHKKSTERQRWDVCVCVRACVCVISFGKQCHNISKSSAFKKFISSAKR